MAIRSGNFSFLRAQDERLAHLGSRALAKAFRGELVPRNPEDQAASVPLERETADA
jgi:hypothetical protein